MRLALLTAAVAALAVGFAPMAATPVAEPAAQPAPPPGPLDGTWDITALIDDGQVFPVDLIKNTLAKDARLVISGQKISLVKPASGQPKELLFVTDPKANPATIDIGGAEATGGKGIYVLAGNTLMVCLSGPGITARPTDFSSREGSHNLLMTLQRVTPPAAIPQTQPAAVTPPTPAGGKLTDETIRKLLVGTWGSQDRDKVDYGTFNADGTFSSTRTWKRSVRTLFDEDVRSSGTWKLENGSLVVTVTASTDRDLRGQVYTYRVNSISETDFIFLDQQGNVRREWRVR